MFKLIRIASESTLLREEILRLELQQQTDRQALVAEFRATYEQLTPATLIQRTVHDLATVPHFKSDLISIGAGFLTRKLIVGNSQDVVKHVFGSLVQAGVTHFIAKNADHISSVGSEVFNLFFTKHEE